MREQQRQLLRDAPGYWLDTLHVASQSYSYAGQPELWLQQWNANQIACCYGFATTVIAMREIGRHVDAILRCDETGILYPVEQKYECPNPD